MLKKILAALGLGAAATSAAQGLHTPYKQSHSNFMYNLLFCDDIALFKPERNMPLKGPWAALFSPAASVSDLRALAGNEAEESRLRVLAYNKLRESRQPVLAKKLLGVIVEVPLAGGLDVLAAYTDGRIRYINQSEKMAILEDRLPDVAGLTRSLMSAAQPLINKIGPWDKPRLPAPKAGTVRLTFLVSDGLYFGQGPYGQLRQDPLAGPVLAAAEQLLQAVVDKAVEPPGN